MKVKLIKNVFEAGSVKCSKRRRQADGTYAVETVFVSGNVIDMSDASAVKYIAAGLAELYVEAPAPAADEVQP